MYTMETMSISGREVSKTQLPSHVAIIMDGNGRWAQKRGLPRGIGHRAGVEALRSIIRHSDDLGIKALTIYAFSTENWKRSVEEVGGLMALLLEFFARELNELHKNGVRIRILGDIDGMPAGYDRQKAALRDAEAKTCHNGGLKLNIAINYGGQQEILRACRLLAEEAEQGRLNPKSLDASMFESKLYTAGLPDVDLVIRTSGEMRISNFLLWQLAYSEFYVTDTLWPDFGIPEFEKALLSYIGRDRRYGGVKENKP